MTDFNKQTAVDPWIWFGRAVRVTSGKLAAAFRHKGELTYLLFERAYVDFPNELAWSCIGLGAIDEVMERIFALAAECELGRRRSPRGRITPEHYFSGWLKELANPVAMPNVTITLRDWGFASTWNHYTIPKELSGAGYGAVARRLRSGERVSKSLHPNARLFRLLYGTHGVRMSSLMFERGYAPVGTGRDESLGYRPRKRRSFAVSVPDCRQLRKRAVYGQGPVYVVQDEAGAWRCHGEADAAVANFVTGLWRSELAEPGSFRKRISAFRERLTVSPPVPEGTLVRVDQTMRPRGFYDKEHIQAMRERVVTRPTETGFEFPLPSEWHPLCSATYLPAYCTKWIFPI